MRCTVYTYITARIYVQGTQQCVDDGLKISLGERSAKHTTSLTNSIMQKSKSHRHTKQRPPYHASGKGHSANSYFVSSSEWWMPGCVEAPFLFSLGLHLYLRFRPNQIFGNNSTITRPNPSRAIVYGMQEVIILYNIVISSTPEY